LKQISAFGNSREFSEKQYLLLLTLVLIFYL